MIEMFLILIMMTLAVRDFTGPSEESVKMKVTLLIFLPCCRCAFI